MSNGKAVRMRLMPYCEMLAEDILANLQHSAKRGVDLSTDEAWRKQLAIRFSVFFQRGRQQEDVAHRPADEEPNPILAGKAVLTDREHFRRYKAGAPRWPIVDDEPLTDRQRFSLLLLRSPKSAAAFAFDKRPRFGQGPSNGQVSAAKRTLNRLVKLGVAERLETEDGPEWRITEAGIRAIRGDDYQGEMTKHGSHIGCDICGKETGRLAVCPDDGCPDLRERCFDCLVIHVVGHEIDSLPRMPVEVVDEE